GVGEGRVERPGLPAAPPPGPRCGTRSADERTPPQGAIMTDLAPLLPARRPELVLRPLDDGGVVKDPRTSQYFQLQGQEYFLLLLLGTAPTTGAIRTASEERFGERIAQEYLDDFLAPLP